MTNPKKQSNTMKGHYSKSRRNEPPNKQNSGYTMVPVKNGTSRSVRFGCAGCKQQLAKDEVNWIVESSRLDAWAVTRFGALYIHATGSAYPHDNRSWPYCDSCLDRMSSRLFQKSLNIKQVSENGESYTEVQCSSCAHRGPASNYKPFVLQPTRMVHKRGGPGMTAASYPVIRGRSFGALCQDCKSLFEPIVIDDIEKETIQLDSVKREYANGNLGEDELEEELKENLERTTEME